MKGKLRVVFVDLDGTIVNFHLELERVVSVISRIFSPYVPKEFFANGPPTLEMIDQATQKLEKKLDPHRSEKLKQTAIKAFKREEFRALKNLEPIDGAKEALEQLNGCYKVVVVTRKTRPVAARALEVLGVELPLIAWEDTSRHKPFPDPLRLALQQLKTHPWNALTVGDHIYDILSGKRAGTYTAAVLTGVCTREELEKVEPDIILPTFPDVVEWLLSPEDDLSE